MVNKAHTAVINRLLTRFAGVREQDGVIDVRTPEFVVAVETEATLSENLPLLAALPGKRYVAGSNSDAVKEALRQTEGTPIGVMSPQGDVLREAGDGETLSAAGEV